MRQRTTSTRSPTNPGSPAPQAPVRVCSAARNGDECGGFTALAAACKCLSARATNFSAKRLTFSYRSGHAATETMQASCGADDDTRRLTTSYLYNGEGSNAMTYDDHINDACSLALQFVLYTWKNRAFKLPITPSFQSIANLIYHLQTSIPNCCPSSLNSDTY